MKSTYLLLIFAVALLFQSCSEKPAEPIPFTTICNPMNLSYRFRPETDEISRREAADPTIIKFKGEYWLFASKSGGYWYSKDMAEWTFVLNTEIPTEGYAPTVIAIGDTLYLAVSSKKNDKVYKTADPRKGHWLAENTLSRAVEDPCFFMDDDNKLYLYWGCSNVNPLYGAEIDPVTFKFKSDVHELFFQNPAKLGWEVRGDYNTDYNNPPWLEGLWMTKHNNKFYLQYSAPGTLEKCYSDGVYVSENPLGPFELATHNPFSYKPEGFACGAGHGSTIQDDYGNWWHLGTISISVKHKFERRIGFYPTFFDADGILHTNTRFGDYPTIVPREKINSHTDLFPGWMLLSYKKKATVSSSLENFDAQNMTDENIRTYWAAKTGNNTEWASIDLGDPSDIYALQINFAEQNTSIYDRQPKLKYRYVVEASNNEKDWETIIDKSKHNNDNSHDYIQLKSKVNYRYLRIKNIEVADGNFALSGFRVFGLANGDKPQTVTNLQVKRNENDRRAVSLKWDKVANANGYNIQYGIAADKRYHNYMVYDVNELTISSLNADQEYYFAIEAFNASGISKSAEVVSTIQ